MYQHLFPAYPIILFLAQAVQGKTVFANDIRGSCQIIGDVDVYGIGIRLNFYLLWGAVLLALLFDLGEDARGIRISSNIIIISVFTNLFLGISENTILMLEFQIVLFLVAFTTLLNVPGSFSEVENTSLEIGLKSLLMAVYAELMPWLIFKADKYGFKDGCQVYIWAYFKWSISSHSWLVVNRISACLAAICGIPYAALGLFKLYEGLTATFKKKDSVEHTPSTPSLDSSIGSLVVLFFDFLLHPVTTINSVLRLDLKRYMRYLRWALTFFHLFLGILSILFVEKTIQINNIDMSSAKLTDSGQLIPLLTGALGVVIVCWSILKKLFGPEENEDASDTELQNLPAADISSRSNRRPKPRRDPMSHTSASEGNLNQPAFGDTDDPSFHEHQAGEGVPRRRTAEMEAGITREVGRSSGFSSRYA